LDYFEGKVALITGSARGIGFAIAELLGKRGAKIVISDILEDTLAEAEEKLSNQGVEALAAVSDVTAPEKCSSLVKLAVRRFGKLDIVINNAGVSIVDRFENCTPGTCKRLMDVNLMGAIYMSIAAVPALKDSKGHLVFVSSVSGIRSIPTGGLYGASKAALRSLAESIRLELKDHGVHVGVISPGFTTTEAAKTVMKGDGSPRPIDRPPHDTPEGVALGIARLIEKRERERVLTPLGKLTLVLQRISPGLVDRILYKRELKN
jgi:NAD(P)-dependent dehydrogenase (short-subunit alcohol dehydrogenase family)